MNLSNEFTCWRLCYKIHDYPWIHLFDNRISHGLQQPWHYTNAMNAPFFFVSFKEALNEAPFFYDCSLFNQCFSLVHKSFYKLWYIRSLFSIIKTLVFSSISFFKIPEIYLKLLLIFFVLWWSNRNLFLHAMQLISFFAKEKVFFVFFSNFFKACLFAIDFMLNGKSIKCKINMLKQLIYV